MFIHYTVIMFVMCFIAYSYITDKYARMMIKGFIQAVFYTTVFGVVLYLFVESFMMVVIN